MHTWFLPYVVVISALALTTVEAQTSYVIESPRVTTWGSWGPWVNCPSGQFVNGMQLKREAYTEGADNTGLNGIMLYCKTFGSGASVKYNSTIQSSEGSWGSWGSEILCDYGGPGFATGFNLDVQKSQGTLIDDIAANNMLLYCNYDNGTLADRMMATINYVGNFTGEQMCKPGYLVCGIRTQVESNQGNADDTTLNNVDMKCCSAPTTSITPLDPGATLPTCTKMYNYTTIDLLKTTSSTFKFSLDKIDAREGYVRYKVASTSTPVASSRRRKRQVQQCVDFPQNTLYDRLMTAIFLWSLTRTVWPTPSAVPVGQQDLLQLNDQTNPVHTVLRRRIGSTAQGQPVFRTEVLLATIYPRHMGQGRTDFTDQYHRTYLGGTAEDQRGHVIGSQFGGRATEAPDYYYNLVPQHQTVNQDQPNARGVNILNSWVQMERRTAEHIQTTGGWAQYAVSMEYSNLQTGRPSAFHYVVTLYGPNGNLVEQIVGILQNDPARCFFLPS